MYLWLVDYEPGICISHNCIVDMFYVKYYRSELHYRYVHCELLIDKMFSWLVKTEM